MLRDIARAVRLRPPADGTGPAALLAALRRRLGPDAVLADEAALAVYARDASHLELGRPLAVALPADAAAAADAIALCARHGVPFVPRGGGTGLSGGALPPAGAVVIATARLDAIGPVDATGRRVTAGPGALNETIGRVARAHGLHFAPDPSSQAAATLGGNVAENAGGPHTLKVGVTLHHLRRLEWVDPAGRRWATGRGLAWERGLDLLGLLTGSEGTLGLVTAADLRLVPAPRATATLLALFPRLDDATAAVVELMGRGVLPAAVELIDRAMLQAVEQAFRFGFPTDQAAAMVVEFDGEPEAVDEDAALAAALLAARGASSVRRAADEAERTELWRCRKRAFGAVGRLAPTYISMDVCVPLASLPAIVRAAGDIAARHGVRIATALHAGDGNLHPGVHYDARDPDLGRRAHAAADAIILAALAMNGSVTGEHGVGVEKRHLVGRQLDRHAAGLMHGIKKLCDPAGLCNPGKALPPEPEACGEPPREPASVVCDAASLTVTAPAGARLSELQAAALAHGLWIPLGLATAGGPWPAGDGAAGLPAPGAPAAAPAVPGAPAPPRGLGADLTVAELVAAGLPGPSLLGRSAARDLLLELWAETGDGRRFHAGAPVGKNVAGYDLVRLIAGAGGALAACRGATFQLKPAPERAALWRWRLPAAGAGSPAGAPARGEAGRWLRLAELVRGWDAGLAGAAFVVEEDAAGGPGVTVLAAGRDRPWDLDRRAREVAAWAGPGAVLLAQERAPFAEAGRWLGTPLLPAWAGGSPDWTALAREPAVAGGAAWPAARRFVWCSSPELCWLPAAGARLRPASAGWHAEPLWENGRLTDLPEPPAGAPRELLRGLKALFDPAGRWGGPAWLAAAARQGPAREGPA